MDESTICEMPDGNPLSEEIREILSEAKSIAIVGLSDKPERDSYQVGSYLKEHGYRIIPVNPTRDEILGEKSHRKLADVPEPIDIVDIFRRIEELPAVVDEAIMVGAKVVWMQLGLAHHVSAEKARAAGLRVVQSKCIKAEHVKLMGEGE